jgi:hypothetical protein
VNRSAFASNGYAGLAATRLHDERDRPDAIDGIEAEPICNLHRAEFENY